MAIPHANDPHAMREYREQYEYDEVGNILHFKHTTAQGGWTRCYQYADDSNRLLNTGGHDEIVDSRGSHYAAESPASDQYRYNAHGSMIRMPHLPDIEWDYEDQMQRADLEGGGRAYFVYDADGVRVRKVHAHVGSTVEERIYLGNYEIYRLRNGSGPKLERETLHIMDDERRIALVETKADEAGPPTLAPTRLVRYQLGNHLDSASLELDGNGAVISYEEYSPFGSTAFHATDSEVEASPSDTASPARNGTKRVGCIIMGRAIIRRGWAAGRASILPASWMGLISTAMR